MSYATCHTSGCENADITLDVGELTSTDERGETTTSAVQCGVCGQIISDVTDDAPATQP